jgi:sulfate permease, SulP family
LAEGIAQDHLPAPNVEVVGYNRASADIIDRFALHDKTGFELGVSPH